MARMAASGLVPLESFTKRIPSISLQSSIRCSTPWNSRSTFAITSASIPAKCAMAHAANAFSRLWLPGICQSSSTPQISHTLPSASLMTMFSSFTYAPKSSISFPPNGTWCCVAFFYQFPTLCIIIVENAVLILRLIFEDTCFRIDIILHSLMTIQMIRCQIQDSRNFRRKSRMVSS